MKKIFFLIAACSLLLVSCGNKTSNESTHTHTHADGTVHEGEHHEDDGHDHHDHSNCSHEKPEQESFEVTSDSL